MDYNTRKNQPASLLFSLGIFCAICFVLFGCASSWERCVQWLRRWRKGRRGRTETEDSEAASLIYIDEPPPQLGQWTLHPVQPRTSSIVGRPDSQLSAKFPQECDSVGLDNAVDEMGENQDLGSLHFALHYNYEIKHLTVRIVEAIGLPPMDVSGSSDPFVRLVILPQKRNKVSTSVQYSKLNPKWNEVFIFESFPLKHLLHKTLEFSILDYDRFRPSDVIGLVNFPLLHLYEEGAKESRCDVWRYIKATSTTKGYVGEIEVALQYNPTRSALEVQICRGKGLNKKGVSDKLDTFCTIKLIGAKGHVIESKKTTVRPHTSAPEWNEAFIFCVDPKQLRNVCVEIVCRYRRARLNVGALGKLRLGTRTCPEDARHWVDMANKPRETVIMWHLLKQ